MRTVVGTGNDHRFDGGSVTASSAATDRPKGSLKRGPLSPIWGHLNRKEDHMEKKHIERLYALLERAEREKDMDTAAALRWAILQLENAGE